MDDTISCALSSSIPNYANITGICIFFSGSTMLQENPSDPLNTALMMADKKRSKAISRQLKKEGKLEQKYIKLLLLGPGEAGKSTLIRQMQLIHGEPLDLQ